MTPRDRRTGPVRPLLDRLATRDGGRAPAGGISDGQAQRELRESVRRNLENLLNTRWRCVSWPPDLQELERSMVNYGIPDFTGATFNDPISQREFRKILESAIQRYEPRFRQVRVNLIGANNRQDRVLRFRIDAVLRGGGDPEPIAYETALDPSTANFRVGPATR